ncbi:MAG TPA: cell wall-binding repeat-containing protein, partial [Egibacteraceae bacterium]|nr:cell wall-binding repeat-containing protein [Egibacteraceae bacterium]
PRVGGATRDAAGIAIQVSRAVFPDAAGDAAAAAPKARHVVLARDDTWADSLAGTALSGDWGPILYARGGPAGTLPDETLAELRRVLGPGGRVYLLGGAGALSPAVEQAVAAAGFAPKRLSGEERLRTALAIAAEVRALHPASGRVLVARAYDTPVDALASGAAAGHHHVPLVLSPTPGLTHQFLRDGVAGLGVPDATLVGGTAALSEQVAADLRALGLRAERVSGPTRWHTAVAIADRFFPAPRTSVVAVDLESAPGWAWALAAGALSAMLDAPQLGVAPSYAPTPTTDEIRSGGGTAAAPLRVVVVGDAERVSTAVRVALREAAEGAQAA